MAHRVNQVTTQDDSDSDASVPGSFIDEQQDNDRTRKHFHFQLRPDVLIMIYNSSPNNEALRLGLLRQDRPGN